MADKLTQIPMDEEIKRKLVMIAKEEQSSMSSSVRRMIDARYKELFATLPKYGLTSGKVFNHEVNPIPVDTFQEE